MADIKTRAGEGRPLTNDEVDANFTNLNTDKAENGANSDITSLAGITGGVSTADYVDFDTLATGVARATGRLTWNSNDGCLEVGLIGSDVTQQIGQEMVTRVYNADSTTIANGEVVYFWSTAGEVIAGKKYIANATIDPHLIVGLATEDIAAGAYGYVTEFGFVRSLDTAAFNPGDILFASPTTAGAIQSNEPSTPNDVVRVGICLESDSTNGIVLVNPHDVPRSDEIRYDNSDSGLSATNVKAAIDELELVKADIALLTSNVTFYMTSANDAVLAGYKQLVTSTLDTNYDEIAFDYLTGTISNTATMLQAWASDVNVLVGDIAGIVVPIVGNIRKDTGSGDARFYFEVYIRESDGTETLVTTSNVSDYVTSTIYGQISLSATVSLQTFTDTDRVVIKLYGQTDSSTAQYELQLGGTSPFRSLFPVPVSVVPSVANAYAIVADTTNFNGKLSSTDNNVQEALETLDDHVHQASEITGLTASNTTTTTTQFNGHLSTADTDIQKALNTLDDVGLQGITDVGATTTTGVTINASLDVDDLKLDGDTISNDGAAVDGNIVLSPKGAGEVDISKVDIDGGAIDGTTIGGTTPGAGTFTDLTVNTTATFAGATIADLGTVTTADINGGTIDGVTLDATIADIGNIQIDGNSITSTDGNGDISITPNGLGEVNISKVDIDAGAIDGTTIGATVAAAGNFTALDVSTSASFTGATIDDLGTVTTADINGGTIDGADITVGAGKTLSVISGTLTLADNQISGDKVHGGIISSFQSQGIDDNATSTQLTISNTSASFAGDLVVDTNTLYVDSTNNHVKIGDTAATPDGVLSIRSDSDAHAISIYEPVGANENWQIGVNANGDLGLYDSGSTTASVTFQDGGNVGINEPDPDFPLSVSGDAQIESTTAGILRLKRNDTLTTTGNGIGQIQAMSNHGGSNFTAAMIRFEVGDTPGADGEISLQTSGTERFRVDSDGKVGISVTDPDERLEVDGDIKAQTGGSGAGVYHFGGTSDQTKITGRDSSHATKPDTMEFFTGGTSRIQLDDNGNVGIGVAPDTSRLKVYGDIKATGSGGSGLVVENTLPKITLRDTSAIGAESDEFIIRSVSGQSDGDYEFVVNNDLTSSADEVVMTISGGGNVGIGETSPDVPLHIKSTAAGQLRLEADSATIGPNIEFNNSGGRLARIASAETDTLRFETGPSNTTRLLIDDIGRVGIGTDSPTYKLDVNGTTRFVVDVDEALGNASEVVVGCVTGGESLALRTSGSTTMRFLTGSSESMRIRENGQLLYGGQTNSPANVRMVVFGTGNASTVYNSGHTGIHINNEDATAGNGNFGAGLSFGRFGSSSDDQSAAIVPVQTDPDEDHMGIAFLIHNSNTRSNPLVEKMRITENGVHFSGNTSSATGLDDYEEGTWTPVFTATTTNPTVTYDRNYGFYVKIGRKVYARLEMRTDSVSGGSGSLLVTGLPFNASTGSGARAGGITVHYSNGWGGDAPVTGYVNDNANGAILLTFDQATAQGAESDHSITVGDLNTGGNANYLMAEIVYEAN